MLSLTRHQRLHQRAVAKRIASALVAGQKISDHPEGRSSDLTSSESSEFGGPRGVFVTLFDEAMSRVLRGCIGNAFPKASLLIETARCAIEAATMDPRFDPVRLDEFQQGITVEVTVL